MFNYLRKLPSFNTVGANANSALIAPKGPTYRAFILKYSEGGVDADEATLKAAISRIQLKVNGTSRFDVSGKHAIDNLQKYYGIAHRDGQIVIPLTRPWLKTIEGEENLGWGTKNVDTLELNVAIAAGRVAPEMEAIAFITPEERDLGAIVQVHEFSYAAATSGEFEISSLPKGNGELVALHLENANITAIEASVNGVKFVDADLGTYRDLLRWTGERVPVTGYEHIDAMALNRIGGVWPIIRANDFRIKANLSSAGQVPIVMETLATPLLPSA